MKPPAKSHFLVGVGGIGTGMFFALRDNHTLGRSESRAGRLLRRRDFCKLHIVAHYVAALSGRLAVLPIGKVGDDPAGEAMIQQMRGVGMHTRFVQVEPGASTLFSVCFLYPDGEGGNLTTEDSASAAVTAVDVERAVESLPEVLAELQVLPAARGVALAVPEVPLPARLRLLELGRQRGWFCAAALTTAEAPRAALAGMFALTDLLSVNREEAAALAGMSADAETEAIVAGAGAALRRANPGARLCVTAGAAGAYGWADGQIEHTPAATVDVVNTAGAGDAVLAALIAAEAAGLPFIRPRRPRRRRLADAPLETAMDLAALLAGLAVACEDTINFQAGSAALRELAGRIGADAARLGLALEGP